MVGLTNAGGAGGVKIKTLKQLARISSGTAFFLSFNVNISGKTVYVRIEPNTSGTNKNDITSILYSEGHVYWYSAGAGNVSVNESIGEFSIPPGSPATFSTQPYTLYELE